MRDYVDILEIHPDYVEAECRYDGCDETKLVPASAAYPNGYTICDDHAPDLDDLLGPDVTVRLDLAVEGDRDA